jgi:hypothetical protein
LRKKFRDYPLRPSRWDIKTTSLASGVLTEMVVPVLAYANAFVSMWNKELVLDVVAFTGDTHLVRLQLLAVLVVATPGIVPGVGVSDDSTDDEGGEKYSEEKVSH